MEALGKDDFDEVGGAAGAAWPKKPSGPAGAVLGFFGCQVKVRPDMGCGTDARG